MPYPESVSSLEDYADNVQAVDRFTPEVFAAVILDAKNTALRDIVTILGAAPWVSANGVTDYGTVEARLDGLEGGGNLGGPHPDGDHTTLATTNQLDALDAKVAGLDYSRVIVAKLAGVKNLAGTYATPPADGVHNKFIGNSAPAGTNANIGDEWLKTAP